MSRTRRAVDAVSAIIFGMATSGFAGAAQTERPSLPQVGAPLATTQTSHPFSAAAYQKKPLRLDELGYVESEYLVQGKARVFERSPKGPRALAQGSYTTRILVRRPKDARRFSGTVTGVMNMAGALAASFTAIVYGALFGAGYWVAPFLVSAAVMFVGALIWLFLIDPDKSVVA